MTAATQTNPAESLHQLTPTGRRHWGPTEGPCPTCLGFSLTNRQVEILALTAEGLEKAQIAARLWLTANTVKSHHQNIREQLGAHTMAQAVAIALRTGVIR